MERLRWDPLATAYDVPAASLRPMLQPCFFRLIATATDGTVSSWSTPTRLSPSWAAMFGLLCIRRRGPTAALSPLPQPPPDRSVQDLPVPCISGVPTDTQKRLPDGRLLVLGRDGNLRTEPVPRPPSAREFKSVTLAPTES